MAFRSLKSEGFIISRKNYGEADRLVTIYSKDFGKLTVLAKGIRKPKSRKRGALEIFNLIKFSGSKGKSISMINEAEVIESYDSIRKSIRKVALAYFFMELAIKLTREDEHNENIYLLLKSYFLRLVDEKRLKLLRMHYIHDMLVELGFWPRGRVMENPDMILEEVIERKSTTMRVGKKMLQ